MVSSGCQAEGVGARGSTGVRSRQLRVAAGGKPWSSAQLPLARRWAPHSGIIPGSAARLPLLECPADHVIDLERMGKVSCQIRPT